jgi:hypothetical protein
LYPGHGFYGIFIRDGNIFRVFAKYNRPNMENDAHLSGEVFGRAAPTSMVSPFFNKKNPTSSNLIGNLAGI